MPLNPTTPAKHKRILTLHLGKINIYVKVMTLSILLNRNMIQVMKNTLTVLKLPLRVMMNVSLPLAHKHVVSHYKLMDASGRMLQICQILELYCNICYVCCSFTKLRGTALLLMTWFQRYWKMGKLTSALNMEAVLSSKMLSTYKSTQNYNPDDQH
jgi:hypothetical protein